MRSWPYKSIFELDTNKTGLKTTIFICVGDWVKIVRTGHALFAE